MSMNRLFPFVLAIALTACNGQSGKQNNTMTDTTEVATALSAAEPTVNPEAVKKNNAAVGMVVRTHFSNPDSLRTAVSLLDEAIAIDSACTLAYGNKIKFLMALKEKEKALETALEMDDIAVDDPVFLLSKGMLQEINGRNEAATQTYAQAAIVLAKNKDFINFTLALYLKDNKKYSLQEVEEKFGSTLDEEQRKQLEELLPQIYAQERGKLIEEMLGSPEE